MRRTVVIAGSGVAGLTAAYEMSKKGSGWEVVLLESAERLGGKILSEKVDDVVFEGGPDSFVTNKPWGLELVRELGLEGELLPTNHRNKDVFVCTRGRLRKFPDGLMLMAPVKTLPFLLSDFLPWSAKIRMGLDFIIPRGDPSIDESIGGFARRRFGDEALETIIGPIMAGIHAGDPDKLSMRSTFPQFADMEQEYRSITLGLRALAKKRGKGAGGTKGITLFMTLKGGLRALAEALAGRLPEGCLRLGNSLDSLERTTEGRYRIRTGKGGELLADAVILALPSDKAGKLSGLGQELRKELLGIPFSSTAVVSMIFSSKDIKERLEGFGFVVDRREPRAVMAATYTSTKFPGRVPAGKVFIRCFLGGAGREASVAGSDEEVARRVRQDLGEMLGIDAEPLVTRVYRWNGANPQYNVGHENRVARIENLLRPFAGLILTGSSYRGVGIPECVRSGREAAKRLLAGAASGAPPPGSVA